MIFIDASALVAILIQEPEKDALVAVLGRSDRAATSAIAIYETAMALRRTRGCTIAEAENDIIEFLAAAKIEIIAIEGSAAHGALDAAARYGKGMGHPAQLNLGDCFAYGQAKALKAKLLYKGGDFSATDIEAAS
jgi:ribonuclease VapC